MDVEDIVSFSIAPLGFPFNQSPLARRNRADSDSRVTTSGIELTDVASESDLSSHYGASRRVASPRFADLRTLVIPSGYQQIPGHEAHRQRQEARARMGSIAERRGKRTPAPIAVLGDAPSPPPSPQRRW
ncbi:hypothetical protein N7475_003460 [Penicillium sp. IBT 31633x]|nr:hypothetical protein N7475_003460 [Penicillium sp. IBT 31633x]